MILFMSYLIKNVCSNVTLLGIGFNNAIPGYLEIDASQIICSKRQHVDYFTICANSSSCWKPS